MQEDNWTILFSNKSIKNCLHHAITFTWPTIQIIPHQPNQPTSDAASPPVATEAAHLRRRAEELKGRRQRGNNAGRSIRRSAGECDRRRRRLGSTTREAAAGTGIVALTAALVATTTMFTIMKRKPRATTSSHSPCRARRGPSNPSTTTCSGSNYLEPLLYCLWRS